MLFYNSVEKTLLTFIISPNIEYADKAILYVQHNDTF